MARWIAGWVSLALAGGSAVFAQTAMTEQSLLAKLQQGRFVVLRGMYAGDKLRFDRQGNPMGRTDLMPFSLSAMHVDQVRLTGSKLEVRGVREGLEFLPPESPGAALTLTAAPWHQEPVTITIERDRKDDQALAAAVDKVFAPGLDDALAAAAPEYWQPWLHHYLHRDDPAARLRTVIQQREDGPCGAPGVRPPRQIRPIPFPEFSDAARRAAYGGVVLLHMTVDRDGAPQNIFIVRPLGMGLDEQAVDAARRYQFIAATRGGEPVACELNMEMSFRPGGGYRP